MNKRITERVHPDIALPDDEYLSMDDLVDVEITSEDTAHPIEAALRPDVAGGWRAAEPGKQTIRLIFTRPQELRRIQLIFREPATERTQEYVLRWSADGGHSFQEIVRQQWNFTPQGATCETEDYRVGISDVTVLELSITPDITGKTAFASLAQLRLA